MANHLDLEEQEQLDRLKAFWKQYGNIITWALTVALAAFAGWNLYQRWQISQATQASALYDEVERVAGSGDTAKMDRVFADMKDKFPNTTFAQQAGLLAAKTYFENAKPEESKSALRWVAEQSSDDGYRAIAKLRLAANMVESGAVEEALRELSVDFPIEFIALVADRKGDILLLQGKKSEAKAEFEKAFKSFDDRTEYRRLVEVKLNSLGGDQSGESPKSTLDAKK